MKGIPLTEKEYQETQAMWKQFERPAEKDKKQITKKEIKKNDTRR